MPGVVPPGGGMLSTLPDSSLTLPTGYPPPGFGPAADPLAGGIDFVRVWHAVRRQWLPAVALGLLLGPALAAACWFFLPRGYEAVAWLRVRSNQSAFAGGGGTNSIDYQQYRKTQLELIKSPFVLTAALRQPGISNLSMLAEEKDPVDWLARHLQVSAPSEAEVVQVKLRGPDAREVTQLVNAVTKSYLTDVISKEKTERLARRDMLERKYKENMAEVRSRLETFNNLARSVGSRDSAEVATQRGLLLDHLSTLRASLVSLQRDLSQIDTELAVMEAQARGDVDADSVGDDMLNDLILRHPQVSELNNRLTMLDETIAYQIERSRRGANDPAVRRMVTQREELGRRIEELVEALRPQLASQAITAATGKAVVRSPAMLRMRRDMLAKQIETTTAEFDQVAGEVTALGNANADLEARRNEIEQLQQVTNQMGVQLNASEVDIAMPNRVELLEEARVPGDGDQLFRIMLTVLSGIAGFAAGAGLVVAFEYLRDRLSAVDQVPQRLGLRVLGTVPRISRSAKKPNVGQVAESVDGVRTIISQTGREAPKVILVTSAMAHEGKTTFAAQFAASLARAGHRTLLLDGDLRHPNVHLALGLDLRAGLPELLRGELTADEAVQPTGIEGLFAVTGGGCDYASITALAKPDTAKLLKHFRDSFDHVVVDAGPVHAFADVLLLGQRSDAAIVVTMRDTSRLPLVAKAVDRLRSVGVRVLGTVVNGVSDTNARQLYAAPVVS